jgi:hypothetical protein
MKRSRPAREAGQGGAFADVPTAETDAVAGRLISQQYEYDTHSALLSSCSQLARLKPHPLLHSAAKKHRNIPIPRYIFLV